MQPVNSLMLRHQHTLQRSFCWSDDGATAPHIGGSGGQGHPAGGFGGCGQPPRIQMASEGFFVGGRVAPSGVSQATCELLGNSDPLTPLIWRAGGPECLRRKFHCMVCPSRDISELANRIRCRLDKDLLG